MDLTYLNLGGLDLRSGDFLFWARNLLNSENKVITNDVYSPGTSFNRTKINQKKFVLNGYIRKDIAKNWSLLNSVLSRNELIPLAVNIPGMVTTVINVAVENVIYSEPQMDEVSISVVAPDPRLYALNEQVIDLTGSSVNALVYPITYPITYGSITGLKGSLVNAGNTIAYPRFEIYGPCSNISLKNNTTGQVMNFNITLDARDTLEVDCAPLVREIRLNGVKNMGLKDGDWITCLPGNNEIEISRTSLVGNNAQAFLRSAWL